MCCTIENTGEMNMRSIQTRSEFKLDAMQEHAGEAAKLLKALANERRLQVLCLLAGGERSVGELNELLDLSQSALSQHLAKLRAMDLVRTRRDRQTIYYSCSSTAVEMLLETMERIFGPLRPRRQPSEVRDRRAT